MSIITLLIPVSVGLGLVGLVAIWWSVRNGQFEDPAGDADRIFLDPEDRPLPARHSSGPTTKEATK